MPTSFDNAPPPTTVDTLLAVPIDIETLSASLRFDAAAESCTVDATIAFVVGPVAGNPLFDLRQTIDEAWLDGAPIDPALLAHHDFGSARRAAWRSTTSADARWARSGRSSSRSSSRSSCSPDTN